MKVGETIFRTLIVATKINKFTKKGFTLIEIIIVIILISVIYYLTFANFNTTQAKVDKINLFNLKQTLKKMNFNDKVSLKCIDNEKVECFFVVDGTIQNERFTGLFDKCPTVYEYSRHQKVIYFDDVELERLETLPICFEYELKKSGQGSQMFVETENNVYIYDNILDKPTKIDYINDVSVYFDDKISEVKDAF